MPTWIDGGSPVVTGTDTMTTPGGYQFSVAGGNGPYTWSIVGTGASIDQTGYVSLSGACGSFVVTCVDCAGRSHSHAGTRVTNNGNWYEDTSCDDNEPGGWMNHGKWCKVLSGDEIFIQGICPSEDTYSTYVYVDIYRLNVNYWNDMYACFPVQQGSIDPCPFVVGSAPCNPFGYCSNSVSFVVPGYPCTGCTVYNRVALYNVYYWGC